MQTLSNSRALIFAALLGGGFVIGALYATPAGAESIFDIEFPIAELGGCEDRLACKAYCNEPSNQDACVAFAKRYGLGGHAEAEAKVNQIVEDGGPGGCAAESDNPAVACKAYCDISDHIEECVAYAKEHSLMAADELAEAEKVVGALKRGAKLPPQCANAKSCKQVCEDPDDIATARACFEFGKEAGLLPPDVSVEQAEKVFASLESGRGPFKSFAEMRQCENPQSDELLEKCVNFGIEAGFIPPEEAAIIKKTGGKGPGGCRGREECDAYCETNPEACFSFAQEHGLVRPEDQARMQEGVQKIRQGLDQAPPEVAECVRSSVPDLDSALSGQGFIGRDVGEKMRTCFESFAQNQQQQFGQMGPPQRFGPEGNFGPQGFEEGFEGEQHGPPPGFTPGMMPGGEPGMPPGEQYGPPPGMMGEQGEGAPPPDFENQYQQQYQQQYEQQYQQQYEQQYQQYQPYQQPSYGDQPPPPPSGSFSQPPPSGSYSSPPPEGSFSQSPSGGDYMSGSQPPPPPPSDGVPISFLGLLLANVWSALFGSP